MTFHLIFLSIILFELTYALEISIFFLLYTPLDLVTAETLIRTASFSKGNLVLFFGLAGLICGLTLMKVDKSGILKQTLLQKFLILHSVFTVIVLIKFLLFLFEVNLHVLALISAATAIFLFFQIGHLLYNSKILAWQHPTTSGYVLVSGLLLASTIIILSDQYSQYQMSMLVWLGILLVMDLVILFARFRFLTKSDQITRNLAAKLLSDHILLFGGYIIAGIFIPLVFIFYTFWVNPVSQQAIVILVTLGVLSERYIFIIVTGQGKS